jgi:hypothetical protein
MTQAEAARRTVRQFKTAAGRVVGIFVPADFNDFEKFPPFVETEEEREHMRTAYSIAFPERERTTKAHISDNELPLQVIILQRDKSAVTKPHYHVQEEPSRIDTRHEIIICMSGGVRCELFSKDGEFCGDVVLGPGDLVHMYEGHAAEFTEDGTKLIEIKQGPMPSTEMEDKVDLR